jgi:hypothetical protein
MQQTFWTFATALLLTVLGCGTQRKPANNTPKPPDSIGVAWLEPDRTLVMQLRAESKDKALGDALLRYKPDDPAYRRMLDHVGELKPGERKPVPPWCQQEQPKSP